MAKMGCAKCGGTKKMALGGSAVKKAPVQLYGIPQENMGTSSQMGFGKKGGTINANKKINAMNKVKKMQAGGSTVKKTLSPAPKPKTGMDALKALGKYVTTFGFAKEGYNPAPSKKASKPMVKPKKK